MAINTPPGFAAGSGRVGAVKHLYGPSHLAMYPIPRYIYQEDINAMHDYQAHDRFIRSHPWPTAPGVRFGSYPGIAGRTIQRITTGAPFTPTTNGPTLTGVAPS